MPRKVQKKDEELNEKKVSEILGDQRKPRFCREGTQRAQKRENRNQRKRPEVADKLTKNVDRQANRGVQCFRMCEPTFEQELKQRSNLQTIVTELAYRCRL